MRLYARKRDAQAVLHTPGCGWQLRATILLLSGSALSLAQADTCPFNGGWALRLKGQSCPALAPVNCDAGLQARCCPSLLTCEGDGAYNGNFCCPPGKDCRSDASETPQCPDPSWTLWGVNGSVALGGWCCLAGMTGVYQNATNKGLKFGVGCFWSSELATVSTLAAAAIVPTASCKPSGPGPATLTSAEATATAPTSSSRNGQGESSLTPGAAAGVAVGAIAGAALLGALACLLLRRRHAGKTVTAPVYTEEPAPRPSHPQEKDGMVRLAEMPEEMVHEMPIQERRFELYGR